jgi:hypothetical protein
MRLRFHNAEIEDYGLTVRVQLIFPIRDRNVIRHDPSEILIIQRIRLTLRQPPPISPASEEIRCGLSIRFGRLIHCFSNTIKFPDLILSTSLSTSFTLQVSLPSGTSSGVVRLAGELRGGPAEPDETIQWIVSSAEGRLRQRVDETLWPERFHPRGDERSAKRTN